MNQNQNISSVLFDVYGIFTYGKLEGRTNPKAHATVRLNAFQLKDRKGPIFNQNGTPKMSTIKDLVEKLKRETDGVFYKISSVEYEKVQEDVEA